MSNESTIPNIDHDRIVAAIRSAEQKTSGEIRVVVARTKTEDPIAAAQRSFVKLGMDKTARRNGVLIYVSPASRNLAVIGDAAAHAKAGDAFWQAIADTLTEHFKRGEFTEGLVQGVDRAGRFLAEHFPPVPGDVNELPDDVAEE